MTLDPLSLIVGIIIGAGVSSIIQTRQLKEIIKDNSAAMCKMADALHSVRNLDRSMDSLGHEFGNLEITMRALVPHLAEINGRTEAERKRQALEAARE